MTDPAIETEGPPPEKPKRKYTIRPGDPRWGNTRNKKVKPPAPKVDGRKTRQRKHHTDRLAGRPKGIWYPDLVGVIQGYATSDEEFQRRRERSRLQMEKMNATKKMGRMNIPDGWGGRSDELQAVRLALYNEAEGILKIMVDEEIVPDDKAANTALQFAVSVVRATIVDGKEVFTVKDKLAASRLVLDFTRAKPAAKSEVTLNSAEDFLAALVMKANGA